MVLVTLFLLGVVSLFHDDLAPWAEPRLRETIAVDEARALATLQAVLDERARTQPVARIDVDLPQPQTPWLHLAWKEDGVDRAQWLHPETGETAESRSDLGHFLFLMHFLYPLPQGMLLAGLLSTLLLFIVLTGLGLQIGRFTKELVRFRPREAFRTVWGDLHKVLGSIGLPYQAVIAWSAAIICLNAMVLQPVVMHTAFDGNRDAGLQTIGYPRGPSRTGEAGSAPDVAAVLRTARQALPEAEHYRLSIRQLGDAASYVDVRGHSDDGLNRFTTVKVAGDGSVLYVREAGGPTLASRVVEGAYLLHSGTWSGVSLRLLYAVLGLLGIVVIITGNLVWLARRARSMKLFDVLLARLTSGGCGAAALSLASILWANQLLPDTLFNRAEWEHVAFYGGWILAVVVGLLLPSALRSARLLLQVSGAALMLLPLADAVKNGHAPFDGASPYVLGAEISWLALGLVFIVSGWWVTTFATPADEAVVDSASPASAGAPSTSA